MKSKVLILGASSFAGSSFFNFINKKKELDVYGTYNSKKNLKKLIFKDEIKNLKLIRLNLDKKNNSLISIIERIKPQYIFDFASVCMVNESWDNPTYYLNVNLNSKINFIKNLKKFKFLKKFIYIGTPEIFGSTKNPVKEETKIFNPSTPYAISKLSIEQFLIAYNNEIGNKIIIARFSNFYGRGQLEHRLIPKLIKCINNKKKFPIQGDGLSKRDFIFDEDFNDALVKIMKKGQGGQIYHFSTNKFYTINQIIKIVCNFKGVNYKDVIYRVPDRKGKDKFYFLNCKKTSKKLNWKPKNDLFKGILKTIKYYDNK